MSERVSVFIVNGFRGGLGGGEEGRTVKDPPGTAADGPEGVEEVRGVREARQPILLGYGALPK